MSATVLVAGGTGRLGMRVVAALTAEGHTVRVMTRDPKQAAPPADDHVEVVVGDVRDRASVARAVRGCDVVVSAFHGFTGTGGSTPATVDRDGNATLVEAAGGVGAQVLLMSVVGAAPDSPMELFRMKYAAEAALRESGVPFTIVRSTAFLELWIELLRRTAGPSNRPLVFGRGENPVNFVSVRDVASLVDHVVADTETRGETLQIGGPANLTLNQLARLVAGGGDREPRHVPPAALAALAGTVGRVHEPLGRQLRASLAMDREPMSFDDHAIRARFPDLPCTSAAELLGEVVAI